jgi:hypothetical protein
MTEPAALTSMVWGLDGGFALSATAQGWAEGAASVLVNALWQGMVVACGLAICMRLTPRIPARLRYGIWAAGFAALVCLPFLPGAVEKITAAWLGAGTGGTFWRPFGSGMASGSESHPFVALDARWSLAIAALWILASLLRGVGLASHAIRMRRLWKSARPVAPSNCCDLEQGVDGWVSRLRGGAQLCVTDELDRPCVIGFFRPRILIPAWLLQRLTPKELEQVVLHEGEHLRRMDDWANLAQKLCLVVFPLNPALWWLERQLCAEREMACDDGVVGRTQAPRAYALCLAGLAEKGLARREAALSLGAWQRRPELAERVHRLLRRQRALSPAASASAVALVGCGLLAGTFELARCPQLVAFVSPVNQVSNGLSASTRMAGAESELGDVNADAVSAQVAGGATRSGTQAFRAVRTVAILPASRANSLPRRINSSPRTESRREAGEINDSSVVGHSLASLVPQAVAAQVKAQQVSQLASRKNMQSGAAEPTARLSGSPEGGESQASWIVLTTFEEVQSVGDRGDVQGDAVIGEPGVNSSRSISVTRLVMRLVQPTPNTQPASIGKTNSSSQPTSTQPVAIPYRDGWFVIQL